MASTEEPILSRLHRLDIMLRHLEEIRGCNRSSSPKSSCASMPSSETLTSDGGNSSLGSSPKSLEKHCRPMDDVVMETEVKGTIIDRVVQLESRVLKLCVQMEEILEAEKRRGKKVKKRAQTKKKKGLKELVKSCVMGKKPNA